MNGVYLTCTGVLRWNRALAASAAGLMLLALVLPYWVAGVFLDDARLPVAAAYMAVAAVGIVPGAGRRLLPWGALLAGAVLVQVGSAGVSMRACDGQYGELRAALQAVPRGAILVSAQEEDAPAPGVRCSDLRVYDHMAQLVTLERSGYSPTFFSRATGVGVQSGVPEEQGLKFTKSVTADVLSPASYLLWMHFGNHDRPVPPGLKLLRSGSFFDLFSIAGESRP